MDFCSDQSIPRGALEQGDDQPRSLPDRSTTNRIAPRPNRSCTMRRRSVASFTRWLGVCGGLAVPKLDYLKLRHPIDLAHDGERISRSDHSIRRDRCSRADTRPPFILLVMRARSVRRENAVEVEVRERSILRVRRRYELVELRPEGSGERIRIEEPVALRRPRAPHLPHRSGHRGSCAAPRCMTTIGMAGLA